MSHRKSKAHVEPMNDIDIDICVPANATDEEMQVSSFPSHKGRISSAFAEVVAHEDVHLADHVDIGNRRSQSSVTMDSLVKRKSSILLDRQTEQLMDMGFPRGLAVEMGKTRSVFPVRFWILDNSGSMMTNDGSCIRGSSSFQCTRWAELQETVDYHASLAGVMQATTVFRMLNDPGARCASAEFSIGEEGKSADQEVQNAIQIMRQCQPNGPTPLTAHIMEIGRRVSVMEEEMTKKGLQAVVILATDGLPTSPDGITSYEINNQFVDALQQLQKFPIWLVIRLCTDDEEVVKFYNNLDKVLELKLEVLDDFMNEAKEINKYNKWLNYAMPVHRCREIGYQNRILDFLDERPLNKDEVHELCVMLFGSAVRSAPDVHENWNEFLKALSKLVDKEQKHFNPITRKIEGLINVKKLRNHFGGGLFGKFKRK